MRDTIYRDEAIDSLKSQLSDWNDVYNIPVRKSIENLERLPSAQPTIYGYDIRHLELIASVLQEEGLPPERVKEALTDIGRIVEMIMDEFEESLRKAVKL